MKQIFIHLSIIFSVFSVQNAFRPINSSFFYTQIKYAPWVIIGKSIIEPADNANTVIKVTNSQKIKTIRVIVTKGGLNLKKCEIWLVDGTKKTIELRNDISVGEESREIEIGNNPVFIDRIVLNYDTRNHTNSRSEIELWGKSE
jgi:hypothetical protein